MPAPIPVNIPLEEPIAATNILLLLQVPLPGVFVNVIAVPVQRGILPEIVAGCVLTVIVFCATQPDNTL